MFLVDTDPGLDDTHALAMILGRIAPEEIIVTTVAGNVGIDRVTHNARRIVGALSPAVPVYEGARGPLVGSTVDAPHIHGEDGLAGYPWGETPLAPLRDGHAATIMVEAARRYGKDLTIIALGPLTNLALAIRLDPELPHRIAGVVSMGGSPAALGNASINAEFNVFVDPVAAEIVYSTVPALTLITWDVTLRHRYTMAEVQEFWRGDSPGSRLLRSIHDHRMRTDPAYAATDDFGRVDPLAMAIALEPGIVTQSVAHPIVVDHSGGVSHGMTSVDWQDSLPDRPRIAMPLTTDRARLTALMTL